MTWEIDRRWFDSDLDADWVFWIVSVVNIEEEECFQIIVAFVLIILHPFKYLLSTTIDTWDSSGIKVVSVKKQEPCPCGD